MFLSGLIRGSPVGEPRYSEGIKTHPSAIPIVFSLDYPVGEPRYSEGIKTVSAFIVSEFGNHTVGEPRYSEGIKTLSHFEGNTLLSLHW